MASSPTVHIIPALQDNYIYVVENDEKEAFIVDPGEAEPVLDFLQKHHLTPKVILLTHHHWDHVSGIKEIKNAGIIHASLKTFPITNFLITSRVAQNIPKIVMMGLKKGKIRKISVKAALRP